VCVSLGQDVPKRHGGLITAASASSKFDQIPDALWQRIEPCVRKTGVQLYVNGEFVQGPPSSGTLYFNEGRWSVVPRSADAPLRIATRSATANSFLTGGIDEVAIYPKVLTPERIKRHFDVGTGK
jgi:hypothetical protein